MRKFVYFALCLFLMIVVIMLIRFMVYGINDQFGWGFGAGVLVATLFGYLAELTGFKEPRY